MDKLINLNLKVNQLSGGIPPEFGNMKSLVALHLGETNIGGTIPPELGNLPNLWFLNLSVCGLSGSIPNELGNLSKLSYLHLFSNDLTGTVPTEFQNLISLQNLELHHNKLSGAIPDLTNLNDIAYFNILNNSFQFGDFENEFADYHSKMGSNFVYAPQKLIGEPFNEIVEVGNSIELNSNVGGSQNNYEWYRINADGSEGGLIGTSENINITINSKEDYKWFYYYFATSSLVPGLSLQSQYFTLSSPPINHPDYNALVAFYNSTNGDTWTNNTNWLDNTQPLNSWYGLVLENDRVIQLNLGNNNLTGTIPSEIGNFSELLRLYLWSNQLTGSIPPEIGNLSKLIEMDLSPNTFTGSIPPEIGNLANLEVLWLNQNGLSGTIPASIQNLTKLKRLYLQGSVGSGSEFNSSAFSGDFPDLTALPLERLWMHDNFFKFTDIADEFATYKANIPDFRFNPQFTTDPPVETNAAIGEDITLTLTDIPVTAKGMTKKTGLSSNMYQWYKDGVALTENATSNTYLITNAQVTDSGVYHCEITNADVPDMIIKRQAITLNIGSLSIEEDDINTIKIYPNPVSNILNIKLNHTDAEQATLFDMAGKQILKLKLPSNTTVIDMGNLNAGMYILKINTSKNVITKRIVKQ